jgi:uncharacterized protein YbbC (DUF1343 family)/CubicO group peptidase (beta-lactamase class C family)
MSELLERALKDAVTASKVPGAVAYVGNLDSTFFHGAAGARQIVPKALPAKKDTPYDLASLTKVVATTTSIMLLYEKGDIELDAPVSEYLPIPAFRKFTIRHCMTHTAGLHPGMPLYKDANSLNEMLQRYSSVELTWTPGSRRRYSDVGFMILGRVVELVGRQPLNLFAKKHIFDPLKMAHTSFNPPKEWADTCAATEDCKWRGGVIVGKVHDENAYAVGGVSGHAGLFSTAPDLATFCRAFMSGEILKASTIAKMTKLGQTPFYPWQGLGWKIDPWTCGSEGFLPSRSAIGHTGWTGTCIWMDLKKGLFSILLANTCHPSRNSHDTKMLRHDFHAAIAREYYPNTSNTHGGLDRLVWDEFEPVKKKRIAVLANQSSVDQLGRPILDVLALEPTVRVCMAYSPEHGFRGTAEAGEHVNSEAGKVPIISLYGKQKAPTPEELAKIDLFVADLQDVGVRCYTYMATLFRCLEACADAKKPVLLLDRPNPICGDIVEGPISEMPLSITCYAPIPTRHAMTPGELALFFQKNMLRGKRLDLTVYELDGWSRNLFFDQCALPWVPTSPNIPTAETALAYAGMCLFEATNLNEGRGTETPFYIVGAPWLDAAAAVKALRKGEKAGFTITTGLYVPKAIPSKASDPRYKGKSCKGVFIKIDDPRTARPFELALALLRVINRLHPDKCPIDGSIDTLIGSPEVRKALASGGSVSAIIEHYAPALEQFDKTRPKLYGVVC